MYLNVPQNLNPKYPREFERESRGNLVYVKSLSSPYGSNLVPLADYYGITVLKREQLVPSIVKELLPFTVTEIGSLETLWNSDIHSLLTLTSYNLSTPT